MPRSFLIAGLLVALVWASPSHAQNKCAPYDGVVKAAKEKFNESVASSGVASDGTRIEILATPDGSTWTLIVITGNGLACFVTEGVDWYNAAPIAPLTSPDGWPIPPDPVRLPI